MAGYVQIAVTAFFFTVKAEQVVVVTGDESGNFSRLRLYPPAMWGKNCNAWFPITDSEEKFIFIENELLKAGVFIYVGSPC